MINQTANAVYDLNQLCFAVQELPAGSDCSSGQFGLPTGQPIPGEIGGNFLVRNGVSTQFCVGEFANCVWAAAYAQELPKWVCNATVVAELVNDLASGPSSSTSPQLAQGTWIPSTQSQPAALSTPTTQTPTGGSCPCCTTKCCSGHPNPKIGVTMSGIHCCQQGIKSSATGQHDYCSDNSEVCMADQCDVAGGCDLSC